MFNCIKLINEGFAKQALKESLGSDIANYQRWVDYDMERYKRISDKTLEEIKKAGLSVVKDQYGEYEVIAKTSITESTQSILEDSDFSIKHVKDIFIKVYEHLLLGALEDDDIMEDFRDLVNEYRMYTRKSVPMDVSNAFDDVPEDRIKKFWDGYLYQYEDDSLNEANLYEDVNIENEPDNEVLRGILLSKWNKKLTPEEQEVLDKYGFKVDTRGGVKSIYSPETGRKLSLFNHKYDGWTLEVITPESGSRGLRYFNSRADAEASKIDIIKLLSTSRDANSSFIYNRQVYPFGSSSIDYYDRRKDYVEDDLAKLKDKLAQAKEELLNYTEGTSQYYQAKAKIADIESRISSLYADRKDVQRELEAERRKRNMYDADGFSQRRYQQDVVNNNIAKYKELKYRLDSAKKSVEYYGRETNSVAKQRRKDNLLSQIAQLQREIERLDSNTTASDQLYREAVASVDELTAEVAKLLHKDRSSK